MFSLAAMLIYSIILFMKISVFFSGLLLPKVGVVQMTYDVIKGDMSFRKAQEQIHSFQSQIMVDFEKQIILIIRKGCIKYFYTFLVVLINLVLIFIKKKNYFCS